MAYLGFTDPLPRYGEKWLDDIVQKINNIINGRHNAGGSFVLLSGTTTIKVDDIRAHADCVIVVQPWDATAAALHLYPSLIVDGQSFTMTALVAPGADAAFRYLVKS